MQDEIYTKFKKILPEIKRNVSLAKYTTFKVGGPAKYFLIAPKKEAIVKALQLAKKAGIPFFILGSGSNILASDKGFPGLVVKIHNKEKNFPVKKIGQDFLVEVKAGIAMKDLVSFMANRSLSGLEWAGGLPGTFGGAIRGNAGAFGGETKDSIFQVLALDHDLKLRKFSNKQCQFSYRNSIFKEKNWIVLSAILKVKKGDKKTIWNIAKNNINYRKTRHPLHLPNAGSIFKNCDLKYFSEPLQKQLAGVVKKDPFLVVPAAYLLSEAGLKGTTIGKAQVSEKHPNFIVNLGGATAEHILKIIDLNKKEIRKRYGVDLEQEVQFLKD